MYANAGDVHLMTVKFVFHIVMFEEFYYAGFLLALKIFQTVTQYPFQNIYKPKQFLECKIPFNIKLSP